VSVAAHSDVVVVGAGVAGLAAAAALAGAGAEVTLLERRPYVGGRASSYEHPSLGEVVDLQHVLLGCCTNLIQFCNQVGAADKIRWYDKQTFLEPSGRASTIALSGLPAPLHFAPSFLGASMLGWKDKLAIVRGLMEFLRSFPANDSESVDEWLKRSGQTELAIRHFWNPILMATLNDHVARCSTRYAGMVFHELFVKSSSGGRLGIPTVPLSEFYDAGVRYIESCGGRTLVRAGVEKLTQQPDKRWCVATATSSYAADAVILALPFEQIEKLLPAIHPNGGNAVADVADFLAPRIKHFTHSPFTSVLLWYDREITDLDHAWLLDTTIEWFFHKSRIRRYAPENGSYVEIVIAGATEQLEMSREKILATALEELAMFLPSVRKAK